MQHMRLPPGHHGGSVLSRRDEKFPDLLPSRSDIRDRFSVISGGTLVFALICESTRGFPLPTHTKISSVLTRPSPHPFVSQENVDVHRENFNQGPQKQFRMEARLVLRKGHNYGANSLLPVINASKVGRMTYRCFPLSVLKDVHLHQRSSKVLDNYRKLTNNLADPTQSSSTIKTPINQTKGRKKFCFLWRTEGTTSGS